jgi:hypothetical protein
MDCSVERTRHAGVWNITTTDFFFPLVEDPYLQGRIGCCNVLSDLYAMGVTDCDNMLMLVAASLDMAADLRLVCTGHMMRGFNDVAVSAGTKVPFFCCYPMTTRFLQLCDSLPPRLLEARPYKTLGQSSAALRRQLFPTLNSFCPSLVRQEMFLC